MCGEGGRAHGSRTTTATDIAFPHDSALSTDAECTRVCNINNPPAGTDIDGADSGLSSPTYTTSSPENHPTLEYDRSRRGTGPISTRNWTDLAVEP